MLRKSVVLLRVTVLVLFAVAALLSGTAWLANFRFPFAVLQTIGVVDKGAVVGERWHAEWLLQKDDEHTAWLYFDVRLQNLTIDKTVFYPANPGATDYRRVEVGPIRYVRGGNDSRRGSFRSTRIDIAPLVTLASVRGLARVGLRSRPVDSAA